jgi:hypothetical protein
LAVAASQWRPELLNQQIASGLVWGFVRVAHTSTSIGIESIRARPTLLSFSMALRSQKSFSNVTALRAITI